MHHFKYKENELHCEDVPVCKIAEEVGTPFYLYSHATLARHYHVFSNAFKEMDSLVCYSAKANSSYAVLKLFADLGSGLDIVSGGELFRGLKAGFKPEKIVYSGVGKRIDEIDYALESGILAFNVESLEELEVINSRAAAMNKIAPVAIRVNPNVDPKTHPYISTGLKKNKFGIEADAAIEAYIIAQDLVNLDITGIDCHIGSQIIQAQPFEDALESLKDMILELRGMGINIRHLDMGGGLGIIYNEETPPLPDEYAAGIISSLKGMNLKLILEPGRVIVGNAGILVSKVLYRKSGEIKDFVIADAGMNDLARPSMYGAYHGVQPVVSSDRRTIVADIVGPICESGDFLATDRKMPDVKQGELIALMSAGAYGYTMASNYCSRLKPAEIMVKGNQFHVIRKRQSYDDLVAGESIPSFLTDPPRHL
ncbi:MAG: diaminopimelate decarboxylase [Desulfobacterales bacterium]|nr:diaminopimelate decarboxylase [Desulfobacterales bacterium]